MSKDAEKEKSPKKNQTQEKSPNSKDLLGMLMGLAGGEDGEKKPKKRPYLHFKDTGLVIPFWAVVSVEKQDEFVYKGGKYVLVHEIILNRGVVSSPNMPFGEHTLCYENEKVRDDKHAAVVEAMKDHNYEFSEI